MIADYDIYQASMAGTGESPVDNTPMGSTSSPSGNADGSNFWGNIGGAITGAASAFGQLFLTKELAKIQASTATTVANANAQVAAANNQAAAAASNAQAQAHTAGTGTGTAGTRTRTRKRSGLGTTRCTACKDVHRISCSICQSALMQLRRPF